MSHQCPIGSCPEIVDDDKLTCAPHWRQVPVPIQRALYAAWRNGDGAGSPAHAAAMQAAIRSIDGTSPPPAMPATWGTPATRPCRACHQPIIWAKTRNGKPMPLDPTPTADGNVVLDDGIAKVFVKDKPQGVLLYKPHFATCTNWSRS